MCDILMSNTKLAENCCAGGRNIPLGQFKILGQKLLSSKKTYYMRWKKQIIIIICLLLIIVISVYIYRLGITDKIRSQMFRIGYSNGGN